MIISDSEIRQSDRQLDGTRAKKSYNAEAGTDHLKPFGFGLNNVNFGEPYKFIPKEGPAPGQYQDGVDSAQAHVKPKIYETTIMEDTNSFRRPKE